MAPGADSAVRLASLAVGSLLLAAAATRSPPLWPINGDSMATRLTGPHLRWRCDDCGRVFTTAIAEGATCANCGRRGLAVAQAEMIFADAAQLAPSPRLRRGDLLAYLGADKRPMVKRIYGLPGETLQFHEGDLWVDGKRWQKSLPEYRRTAVYLQDSRHRSAEVPRWTPDPTLGSDVWRLDAGDRLRYQHRVSFDSTRPRSAPSAVYDHYAFNASQSRQLHRVSDVIVDFRTRLAETALECETDVWRLQLTTTPGRLDWTLETREDSCRGSVDRASAWLHVACGVLDGRALFAVDGREAGRLQLQESPRAETLTLQFRNTGLGPCQIRRPMLSRDLYLMAGRASHTGDSSGARRAIGGGGRTWSLKSGQWFVLGDNLPASLDSRHVGPIGQSQVLGRVFPQTHPQQPAMVVNR